uniref:Uncharacterized protein n=1 Tax=viral metagenome TaxID=1070528 RepID=A0A6C0IR98_9ZZZZ
MSSYLGSKKCCNGNYYEKVVGPQGYQGEQGPIGSFGNQGFQGFQGNQGATGIGCRGPQGFQGNQGVTGMQGFQGDKTFIIDHPTEVNKYLVHACLEGPENGVYYRGKGKIENDIWTTVQLPNYVTKLATNFTIHLSKKYNCDTNSNLTFTDIDENSEFIVYGNNCEFHWIVYGERKPLVVEPNKDDIVIHGNGPYTWHTAK